MKHKEWGKNMIQIEKEKGISNNVKVYSHKFNMLLFNVYKTIGINLAPIKDASASFIYFVDPLK